MKSPSLPLLGALTALTLLNGACKKQVAPLTNAVIVSDPRLCPCCGGLVINFADKPSFAGSEVSGITNQTDLNIDAKDLPLYVRVSWVTESTGATNCRPNVRITNLERR